MARFDVYVNGGNHANAVPFLVDVQSDLLNCLNSRMVIPLRRLDTLPNMKLPERLTPVLTFQNDQFLLETPKMAAVPLRALKAPVHNLACEQARILAALDFLFQGY